MGMRVRGNMSPKSRSDTSYVLAFMLDHARLAPRGHLGWKQLISFIGSGGSRVEFSFYSPLRFLALLTHSSWDGLSDFSQRWESLLVCPNLNCVEHRVCVVISVTFITTSGLAINDNAKPSASLKQWSQDPRGFSAILWTGAVYLLFFFCGISSDESKWPPKETWRGGEWMHFSDQVSLRFAGEGWQEGLGVTSARWNSSRLSSINSRLAKVRGSLVSCT